MKKVLSMVLCVCMIFVFANVYAENGKDTDKVSELKKYDVVRGYPDGDMHLERYITRAEAVCMVFRMLDIELSEDLNSEFTDLENHWAEKEVMGAKRVGIIDESISSFYPDEDITYQEFVKLVLTALGYKVQAESMGGYPNGYLQIATNIGVTDGVSSKTDSFVTREDAIDMLCNALDIPLMKVVGFGADTEYAVMDGTNGYKIETLRTILEE